MLPYYQIHEALINTLKDDKGLVGVTVLYPTETVLTEGDYIRILLDRREPDEQTLSAGQRLRYNVYYVMEIVAQQFEYASAEQRRDELIALVEKAIISNRRLGREDLIESTMFGGGEFGLDKNEVGYASVGYVELMVRTRVTL